MLVLSRQVKETVLVGDDRTVMAQLSPLDEDMLRQCVDESLRDLAERLLATLGHPVEVEIVDIRGDKARLGIEAAKSIPLNRKEIHDAIQRERRWLASPNADVPNHVMPADVAG